MFLVGNGDVSILVGTPQEVLVNIQDRILYVPNRVYTQKLMQQPDLAGSLLTSTP